MSETKFQVIVEIDYCKGCGLCTTACPVGIMVMDTQILNAKGFHPASVSDMTKCIGCTSCSIMCPDSVITVIRND
jgi:2-oxoglutarate ferredoxin oxidoreductase subunit delta